MPVGDGHSSPVIAGGKVFLHTRVDGKDEEQFTAYDAKTGKELWKKSYKRGPFTSVFGLGPRATPLVAGDKVYTFGVTGILTCWQAEDGKQVWQVDTLSEFKAKNLFFGASCSPLLEGDKVLVNVGGMGASVVAFDKDTGKVVWKALDDPASYASGVAFGEGEQRQIVFLTQQGLVSLRPKDGELFWRYKMVDRLNESSTTPMRFGDFLYASSVTFGSVGLKLGEAEGKPSAKEEWKNKGLTCYFSTPVAAGKEHAYVITGVASLLSPQADLHCVEVRTGKVLWTKPKVGKYHAALLRTGDDKLLMLDDFGKLTLIAPNPKEYEQLAQSTVCGPTWAHPALSDGRVYFRDEKELICVQMGD
jgi:outer membrane protein assembly factor BamB